ncbi:MAG: glycosyltransferase family A protein [Rhizobiaceae bacterium]|nr:glycosyltransferase family A protein [Rhizobiaceae bacterium]
MAALSIITVCKGRLSHLKKSLPKFIAQNRCEVIVVDYDCPENTADYVTSDHPGVKVVKVQNRPNFNNWEARNIGAKQASADLLAFVDADVILAPNFADWVLDNISPEAFGKMPHALAQQIHAHEELTPAANRLEGLLVVPRETFVELEGYDDILLGWGAGGDLDICDRLLLKDQKIIILPETLVESTIDHSMDDRVRFHKMSLSNSHLVGTLYRTSKNSLMRIFGKNMPLEERKRLYALSQRAAVGKPGSNSAKMDLLVISRKIPGANYKIEQTVTTKVTWEER